jgi:transposase
VHDTIERRWRHLNFFQYRCETGGQSAADLVSHRRSPSGAGAWAREGSGFTLLMEALVMFLSAQMPVEGMADLLHETDTRLWRVLIYDVQQAQARRNWSAVRRIAVDETSARRGQRYVTNVLDSDGAGLLLMVDRRSATAGARNRPQCD